jgi:hypothetical protein
MELGFAARATSCQRQLASPSKTAAEGFSFEKLGAGRREGERGSRLLEPCFKNPRASMAPVFEEDGLRALRKVAAFQAAEVEAP